MSIYSALATGLTADLNNISRPVAAPAGWTELCTEVVVEKREGVDKVGQYIAIVGTQTLHLRLLAVAAVAAEKPAVVESIAATAVVSRVQLLAEKGVALDCGRAQDLGSCPVMPATCSMT